MVREAHISRPLNPPFGFFIFLSKSFHKERGSYQSSHKGINGHNIDSLIDLFVLF